MIVNLPAAASAATAAAAFSASFLAASDFRFSFLISSSSFLPSGCFGLDLFGLPFFSNKSNLLIHK